MIDSVPRLSAGCTGGSAPSSGRQSCVMHGEVDAAIVPQKNIFCRGIDLPDLPSWYVDVKVGGQSIIWNP
jgi:hypothetical protein